MRGWLLVLGLTLLGGCRSGPYAPDDLDLLEVVEGDEDTPQDPVRLLAELALAPGDGDWELCLPLPASDAYQHVSSLLVQVAAPARHAIERDDGDRWLQVESEAEVRVSWRAQLERTRQGGAPRVSLPASVSQLTPGARPEAWVAALERAGVDSRVVHGVELAGEQLQARRWVEVKLEDGWEPVHPESRQAGLPAGWLRLGAREPSAALGGAAQPCQPTYRLAR